MEQIFLNRLERALLAGSICSYFLTHRLNKADHRALMRTELEAKRAARSPDAGSPRAG